MSTKPVFLAYVKRKTDLRKNKWLFGYGLFADPVSSLPSDRWLTVADNTRQKRRAGGILDEWIELTKSNRWPIPLVRGALACYITRSRDVRWKRGGRFTWPVSGGRLCLHHSYFPHATYNARSKLTGRPKQGLCSQIKYANTLQTATAGHT